MGKGGKRQRFLVDGRPFVWSGMLSGLREGIVFERRMMGRR